MRSPEGQAARTSGNLEQFEQLAGDFIGEPSGQLRFTVLGGATFTGAIQQDTVAIEGYPFSTSNATVAVARWHGYGSACATPSG